MSEVEGKFECKKFHIIIRGSSVSWYRYTFHNHLTKIIRNIGSRDDGSIYATVMESEKTFLLKCQADSVGSCKFAFELPQKTVSFLIHDDDEDEDKEVKN